MQDMARRCSFIPEIRQASVIPAVRMKDDATACALAPQEL